jgi:hypothetical protein
LHRTRRRTPRHLREILAGALKLALTGVLCGSARCSPCRARIHRISLTAHAHVLFVTFAGAVAATWYRATRITNRSDQALRAE